MRLWLLSCLSFSTLGLATEIKTSAPESYRVKQGDTLWDIAALYLDKPWLWPDLWRNNVHIQNPHLIYPGDLIQLRFDENGEPSLVLVAADTTKPTIRLKPGVKKQNKYSRAIPMLSWSLIQTHIEQDLVMSQQEYDALPQLLGNHDGSVRFATGDVVLGTDGKLAEEDYLVIRKQESLLNDDGKVLGVKARHVSNAEVLDAGLASRVLVNVKSANFEAKSGDRLLLSREMNSEQIVSFTAATHQVGKIVSSIQQHSLLGKYDVVVLDLGQDEVEKGTVMGIYMQGPDIVASTPPSYKEDENIVSADAWEESIEQPAIKVGELIIFKTFDNASFGLIASATRIIRQGAIVAKP